MLLACAAGRRRRARSPGPNQQQLKGVWGEGGRRLIRAARWGVAAAALKEEDEDEAC